jgi:hypothetical protein
LRNLHRATRSAFHSDLSIGRNTYLLTGDPRKKQLMLQ